MCGASRRWSAVCGSSGRGSTQPQRGEGRPPWPSGSDGGALPHRKSGGQGHLPGRRAVRLAAERHRGRRRRGPSLRWRRGASLFQSLWVAAPARALAAQANSAHAAAAAWPAAVGPSLGADPEQGNAIVLDVVRPGWHSVPKVGEQRVRVSAVRQLQEIGHVLRRRKPEDARQDRSIGAGPQPDDPVVWPEPYDPGTYISRRL